MPLIEPINQVSETVSSSSKEVSSSSQAAVSAGNDDKVCWIEVKRYPYQPDHQVELLHLQAEADALLIKLQSAANQ
ncbi:MAG: hypothetical protein ACFB16_21575 [Phormidesmis sp.]